MRGVMPALSSLELIQAHRWSGVLFTTFSLSLSFFEAVVLEQIVRNQIGECTILADVIGVRSAFEEIGAREAGRVYDIEPVAVKNGCFHPKLTAFISDEEAQLVIGSGNLTFGGWGSNLECAEYLHPSFASNAFKDTADFLDALAAAKRVTHAAQRECVTVAESLKAKAEENRPNPNIRVLHSINTSILDQVADLVSDLGGAKRIAMVSPFFGGTCVDDICQRLNISEAYVHVHTDGTVQGSAGSNWPVCKKTLVRAVHLELLEEKSKRLLHAKLCEIICGRGRILLSGSANATNEAWGSEHNIELCVARIQRNRAPGWNFTAAQPPTPTPALPDNSKTSVQIGVLRGALLAGKVEGKVITPFPLGTVSAFQRESLKWVRIAETEVGPGGVFEFAMPEGWSTWRGGHVLIRLSGHRGKMAQGFLSLPELREISRRLGSAAARFLSLLQGTETPNDVAEIMNYIRLNPEWLPIRNPAESGSGSKAKDAEEPETVIVDIETLLGLGTANSDGQHPQAGPMPAWQRFMQDIFAAFREPRGKFENTGQGEARKKSARGKRDDEPDTDDQFNKDIENSLASFEKTLDCILKVPRERRHLFKAFAITHYMCERMEIDRIRVQGYLDHLFKSFDAAPRGTEEGSLYAATALLRAANRSGDFRENATELRRQLLHAKCTLSNEPPELTWLRGIISRIGMKEEFSKYWETAQSIRTPQEEAKLFWAITNGNPHHDDFPSLSRSPEWATLKRGPSNRVIRMKTFNKYCPHCYALPAVQANRLRDKAVATCPGGRVLLCEEI